jgi:hypothetical protein
MINEMKFIEECNGFTIYENSKDVKFPYYIFLNNIDSTYLDAFVTLDGAKDFCIEEDADEWKTNIEEEKA